MRGVHIFSGSSHPQLTEAICERLGTTPAKCELRKFSNGETSVNIGVSIRDQDVFVIQSGSPKINDSVMELLIMISACKGGSAKSITAVMPYFPYSRQSKKKSHRGSITARMLANLLTVAGVTHVITVDLHASQMQGFFGKPVDNLFAEPLIARWIRHNVSGWREAVVVSKNAGGTKRVTSLADALKLNFGVITTDRRRGHQASNMADSALFFETIENGAVPRSSASNTSDGDEQASDSLRRWPSHRSRPQTNGVPLRRINSPPSSSPLYQATRAGSATPPVDEERDLQPLEEVPEPESPHEYTDERARDVITGRLIQGHIVDDDHPSPALSAASSSTAAQVPDRSSYFLDNPGGDPMTSSFMSNGSGFHPDHALGGTFDAGANSDEEDDRLKNPEVEQTITLVGNVRDKVVFLVDDMIDKAGSWIAAAEAVVIRGGAKKVYCIATHGLFGDESLEEMANCECIDYIVVTNSFPISQRARESRKLVILDLSNLLSESIRRLHYGESISALFQLQD